MGQWESKKKRSAFRLHRADRFSLGELLMEVLFLVVVFALLFFSGVVYTNLYVVRKIGEIIDANDRKLAYIQKNYIELSEKDQLRIDIAIASATKANENINFFLAHNFFFGLFYGMKIFFQGFKQFEIKWEE